MHLQRRQSAACHCAAATMRTIRGSKWATLVLQIVLFNHLHGLLSLHFGARGDTGSSRASSGRQLEHQQRQQQRIASSEMQIDARNLTATRVMREHEDELLAKVGLVPDETTTMRQTRQPAGAVQLGPSSRPVSLATSTSSKGRDDYSSTVAVSSSSGGSRNNSRNSSSSTNTKTTTNDWRLAQVGHRVPRTHESNIGLNYQLATAKTTKTSGGGGTRRQISSTEQHDQQVGTATANNSSSRSTARRAGSDEKLNYNNLISRYKLPTWFNFEAYKQLYGKQYRRRTVNELHKRIYLQTSLRVFEQRAQYRARRLHSLASVNELSDMTSEQLAAFKVGPQAGGNATNSGLQLRPLSLPECCSYDQVYARIIELLNSTTSSNDTELSRALLAELEQRPLVLDQSGVDEQDRDERVALVVGGPDRRQTNRTINELSGANLADDNSGPSLASFVKSIGQSGLARGAAPTTTAATTATTITKFHRPIASSGGPTQQQQQSTDSVGSDQSSGGATLAPNMLAGESNEVGETSAPDKLRARLVHQANQAESGRHKQSASASTATSSSSSSSFSSSSSPSSSSASHSSGKPFDTATNSQAGTILDDGSSASPASLSADGPLRKGLEPLSGAALTPSDAIGRKNNLYSSEPAGGGGGGVRLAASPNRRLAASSNWTLGAPVSSSALARGAALHQRSSIAASNNNNNELAAARRQLVRTSRTTQAPPTSPRPGVVEGGGDSGEGSEEDSPQVGVPPELEEAVRRQVAEQLSPESAFGRQINKQLSDYFGEQVEIRTRVPSISSSPSRTRVGQPTTSLTNTSRRPLGGGG